MYHYANMNTYKLNLTSFFVIGAERCGTESIHYCLNHHPKLSLRPLAHSGHFANDLLFDLGQPKSEIYDSINGSENHHLQYGEVCSRYLSHPRAISRIYHYNPHGKLIISLRNPAERAYSHWQSRKMSGEETRSFKEAIENEVRALDQQNWDQSTRPTSYLRQSRYADQIQHARQYFNPHNLLFIKAEDLRDDTEVSIYQILQFLGLPYIDTDCIAQNVGKYSKSISQEDYEFVQQFLYEDILNTQAMLGWNCTDWVSKTLIKNQMSIEALQ